MWSSIHVQFPDLWRPTPYSIIDYKQTFVMFIPQANYSDWATAIGRRILVLTFMDRGLLRAQRGGSPTAVNLRFLDRSRYFFFHVALNLFSQG
jgi:hypothetical protein